MTAARVRYARKAPTREDKAKALLLRVHYSHTHKLLEIDPAIEARRTGLTEAYVRELVQREMGKRVERGEV
jgi:hypothetical protein